MPAVDSQPRAGSTISFYINGKKHVVPVTDKLSPSTSLNDYIRDEAGLTGTKVMCREAGCGCCAVSVTTDDPYGPGAVTRSINSCLCPLLSVDGWQITTVEGVGSEKEGLHPIQSRLASYNATQCGYCTPGMVMNMYGLLHENPKPSEQDVEDGFDGNICRCTGYRSILDAMKSFAVDTANPAGQLIDIEDLNKKLCPRTGQPCNDHTQSSCKSEANGSANGSAGSQGGSFTGLYVESGGSQWYRPSSLQELGGVMRNIPSGKTSKLLFGNTAAGIFKDEGPFDVYIDLREVKELYDISVSEKCVRLGASTSLSTMIKKLKELKDQDGFHYLAAMVRHLKLVGNVLMRNSACVAGNLMIKHYHHDFPSDVFAMTEALGAKVQLYDSKTGKQSEYRVEDFVRRVDMKGKVLVSLELPALDTLDVYRSFKITPRSQNAHAYVNAAFKLKVTNGQQIMGRPSIVIGGISDTFFHAERTEDYLRGKHLNEQVVKEALAMLKGELEPTPDPVLAPVEYRRDLAVNLLYKTLLGIVKPSSEKLVSGSSDLERPLSSGVQTWKDNKAEWPLKQAMPKKTAHLQATGEAEYVNDIPKYKHELCGSMVLTTLANASIDTIDPSPALAMEGVVAFIGKEDIPEGGQNNAFAKLTSFPFMPEEVFCTGKVEYAGQSVGMILAESQAVADAAAKKVKVTYKDVQKPILSIQDALDANSLHPCFLPAVNIGNPDEAMTKAARTVEGEVKIGQQIHFYMETICTLCVPGEEGMEVYNTTQFGQAVQCGVAGILNKPLNYVNVHVPRLGGSFGGKCFASNHVGLTSAVAAYTTGRPVRSSMSLSNTMRNSGKRPATLIKYKAGFSASGQLEAIVADVIMDGGVTPNMTIVMMEMLGQLDQGYYVPNWKLTPTIVKTNTPSNTFVRGPGTTPSSTIMESIMEHVAKAVNKHPILVKELNLYQKNQKDLGGDELTYCTMRDVWGQLKVKADISRRMDDTEAFNKINQWKKRGVTMSAVKYGMHHGDWGFPLLLSVYAPDGTVTVVTGGVEMGQGLYTKVAQAAAHGLGLSMDMIKIRPSLTYVTPNASVTGGSTGSEKAVMSALEACRILVERMEPVKAKMPDADWVTLVQASLKAKIDLSVKVSVFDGGNENVAMFKSAYNTYCAAAVETEVDVLTGEFSIRRVDIMFDCGESLNPMVDMGQIEGGFVYGLGFNLLENVIHDKDTGNVLNDGTWEYKPPTTKDIPIDWRIHLLADAPNPVGIRGSKASGEPPTCVSSAALMAVKQCVESASTDVTGASAFIPVDVPFTMDKIQQTSGIQLEHLTI